MKTPALLALVAAPLALSLPSPAQDDARPSTPARALPDGWSAALPWTSIGPANMGGRMIDVEVHPHDRSTWWIATASGGLLKTVNNGVSFEHQFDREETVSIGAFAVAPNAPDTLWVGTGENNPRNSVSYGNGVYKSTDGGASWTHKGLDATFQIGDIVVHPDNADVVFVGALGRLYGPNPERGLYKTVDGGETWQQVLGVDDDTGVIDIAVHPTEPNTMLVATYERRRDGFDGNDPATKHGDGSGLWRTTDGGATFQRVTAGLPTSSLGRIGLDWYRKDPNVVFALVECENIGKLDPNLAWSGIQVEDADAGAKVTAVTEDGPGAKAEVAVGDVILSVDDAPVLTGRKFEHAIASHLAGASVACRVVRAGEDRIVTLELTKRPKPDASSQRRGRGGSRGDRPFGTRLGGQVANRQHLQGPDGHEYGGLYRSDDGGVHWRRLNSINPRPMYFSHVKVDPTDDQRLYVLGISMSRSADGGETFTADASRGVHSDQQAMWIDPDDPRHMILATDGGLYVTWDRCETWDHLNHMALGQFYHVAVGPRRDYWVYGGLQDNGTWGAPRRAQRSNGTINEDWLRIGGGDGFVVQVDRNDPNQIYYESQNGGMGRTHLATYAGGRIRPRAPEGTRYRFNWRTPFILSNHNSRIYYVAGNHVFRSLDRGDDLKAVSPEITRTDRGSATALAESPLDSDVLYVGTDDGALWGTRDGGRTWTDLWAEVLPVEGDEAGDAGPRERGGPRASDRVVVGGFDGDPQPLAELVPGPRWVSSIEASRDEEGRVYLTLDGHRSDDDAGYVFASEDFGATWRSIGRSLPRGSTRVVREDRQNRDLLWLGTEFGLWASLDRGRSWTRLNGDTLPTVAVHEIAQHELSGEIVAGTHGRSLWVLDATPIRQLTADVLDADASLLRPAEAVQWRSLHRRGVSGARRFYGQNPSSSVSIDYVLGKRARRVALRVESSSGTVLREFDASTDAGMHRVRWDMRQAAPSGAAGGNSRFRFSRRPRVSPGSYTVVLEVDGDVQRQPLVIVADPSFPAGDSARDVEVDVEDRDGDR